MAMARFPSSTMTRVKVIELTVDQTTATATRTALNSSRLICIPFRSTTASAARLTGKTQ